MKSILIPLAFASTLLSTPVKAEGGYFEANTHVLVGTDVVTGEYAWAEDDFSGYGFIDKSLKNDFVITDHEVRAQVVGALYANIELGYNRFGGAMGKVGVGVNLAGLPVAKDHFVYLRVYAQKSVFGPNADRQVGVAWGTKDLHLTNKVSIYASGFADIKHNAPDVLEPQLWLKFKNSPIEIGSEISFYGKDRVVSAAVKLKF